MAFQIDLAVDYERAREWYARLLGTEPSFLPNDAEAVWTLAEGRHLYIKTDVERAGDGPA